MGADLSSDGRERKTIRLRPGGTEKPAPRRSAPGAEQPPPPAADPAREAAERRRRAALAKEVRLTRAEPAARLGDAGLLQVNLNWSARAEADVDLCVLAEFTDGTLQVVQALGDAFGRLDAWPYIALDHDDRSGASADGETLRVNLDHHHLFRRLLFFTYLYEGSVSFRELGASVTVSGTAGTFRILLDDAPATAAGCAVALTESDGTGLTVRREVRWFDGHPELGFHQLVDQAYGFGLSWTRMDKPPRLG